MPATTFKTTLAKVHIARIAKALHGVSLDAKSLADATFSSTTVTQRFLTHLHKNKFVYISGWQLRMNPSRPMGWVVPMYSWGLGVDVAPVSITSERVQ